MKKWLSILLSSTLLFSLVACGASNTSDTSKTSEKKLVSDSEQKTEEQGTKKEAEGREVLKISATLDPHSRILEKAKEILASKYHVDLEIQVLDDYFIFNKALDAEEVDANYFQHRPFFQDELKANNYKLKEVAAIHIEPFGFYSKRIKDISELKEGDTLVISNSVSDYGRILSILENAGLLELASDKDRQSLTLEDISKNPLHLTFKEVKPELLSLALENDEGALVAINGNYAIQAGLSPAKDAVLLEKASQDNPYVNIVVVKEGHENEEKIKALVEVLTSKEIKDFIHATYADGSVIPVE